MVETMKTITHYFSGHSQYAYIGFSKLLSVARNHGLALVHRPMDLHRVMVAAGSSAFEDRPRAAIRYFFVNDARRWARFRGVEWDGRIPETHLNPYEDANLFLICAQQHGIYLDDLAFRLLRSHWADGSDLTDVSVFKHLLEDMGTNTELSETVVSGIHSDDVRAEYESNTEAAIEISVLGSPSYVVDGEMFYGQDRLELLDWMLGEAI